MNAVAGRRALVLIGLLFSLIACSRKEIHSVELRSLSADHYILDGSPINHSELAQRLKALMRSSYDLCVNVIPLEGTPYANTVSLMHEIQKAGVTCVGMTGVDEPN